MSKGACITKMGTVRNYNTKTIMEKNKQEGGGGFKDMEYRIF